MADFDRVTLNDVDLARRALYALAEARRKERARAEQAGRNRPPVQRNRRRSRPCA